MDVAPSLRDRDSRGRLSHMFLAGLEACSYFCSVFFFSAAFFCASTVQGGTTPFSRA